MITSKLRILWLKTANLTTHKVNEVEWL